MRSSPGPRLPGRPGSFRPARHRPAKLVLACLFLTLPLLTACLYSFRAGAGLPPHVQSLAVAPFENETDRFDLAQEIYEAVLQEVPRTFGVRVASEEDADAVIRGTVRRYSVDAPSYRPTAGGGAQVLERAVSISLELQVVDLTQRLVLWENRSLTVRGQFLEDSELEEDGRDLAIEQIVRDIINGLQSNW